jgi:serine O-acetyltransferase
MAPATEPPLRKVVAVWRIETHAVDRVVAWMAVAPQRLGRVGWLLNRLLVLRGTDYAISVRTGTGLRLRHAGIGVIVHPQTSIGDNVTIYPNVTVGRSDVWRPANRFGGFEINSEAILCSGCVILNEGPAALRVGEGTVVGANAVLNRSTGDWEIWAGAPALRIGMRDRPAD